MRTGLLMDRVRRQQLSRRHYRDGQLGVLRVGAVRTGAVLYSVRTTVTRFSTSSPASSSSITTSHTPSHHVHRPDVVWCALCAPGLFRSLNVACVTPVVFMISPSRLASTSLPHTDNSCRWRRDGECDDGGPDAPFNLCDYGTDCADCGARPSDPSAPLPPPNFPSPPRPPPPGE